MTLRGGDGTGATVKTLLSFRINYKTRFGCVSLARVHAFLLKTSSKLPVQTVITKFFYCRVHWPAFLFRNRAWSVQASRAKVAPRILQQFSVQNSFLIFLPLAKLDWCLQALYLARHCQVACLIGSFAKANQRLSGDAWPPCALHACPGAGPDMYLLFNAERI